MNYWLKWVLMAVVAGSAAQEGRNASLGGTWVLDATKSGKLSARGQAVANAEVTLIVDNRESTIHVKRIVRSAQGERVRELHFSTDGTEDTNLSFRGSEVKSKSWWSKGQLITKGRQTLDSPLGKVDAELTDIWTVSADGRTLTIEFTFKVPVKGEQKHKEVYLKKG